VSYVERHIVDLITTTGGVGSAVTPVVTGRIASVQYIPSGTGTVFASTADFTVLGEAHATPIWSEANVTGAKTVYPLAPANTTTGGSALLATGVVMRTPIYLAKDRVTVSVAQGGNTKTGRFVVTIA